MLSIPHMVVVFIIVLVVFGPNKLPELARGLGKLMAEFRKASTDFKSAFEQEMRDIERQAMVAERKKAADAAAAAATASAPATLATPPGAETQPGQADGRSTAGGQSEGGAAGADTAAPSDADTSADKGSTGPLVVTPAAEAIARDTEITNNGASHGVNDGAEPENTIGNPPRNAAPQEAAPVADNDPAHDTQQPA
jgi:sec-independent protein translocase protein TatB